MVHPKQPHLLISILEDHTKPAPADVTNKLVCVNTNTQEVRVLVDGADFYSFPAISPDGNRLAFVRWFHPHMPWEAAELYVVDIVAREDSIGLDGKITFVSGKGEESVSQPQWISNDKLVFLTDKSGFYNPWIFDAADGATDPILRTPLSSDFGEPDWSLGDYRAAALTPTALIVAPIVSGKTQLSLLHVLLGQLVPIDSPFVYVSRMKRVSDTQVAFIGIQDTSASALVLMTLDKVTGDNVKATFSILKQTSDLSSMFPSSLISLEVPITLPNPDNAHPLHVLLASPHNPDYDPQGRGDGEKPPCIVMAHGGPTSRTAPGLSWATQYFTSRGWAL